MNTMKTFLTLALATTLFAGNAWAQRSDSFGQTVVNTNITEAEVQAAQEAWGKALIQIGQDYDSKGIKKATATANAQPTSQKAVMGCFVGADQLIN